MKRNIASNIWKLNVIRILHWFMLVMPIIVLFYQENGLTMMDVFILQSAYGIGILLFEIPSGYFSDLFGRRKTMIIGCIMFFLGWLIYSTGGDFMTFLLAEIICGFGSSFLSGTQEAMLYDTLIQIDKKDKFKKLEGRRMAYGNFSESTASIIGGSLALISLRAPFIGEAILAFVAILFALTLIEPDIHGDEKPAGNMKDILKVVKFSLHDSKEVKWLIIYSSIVGSFTLVATWFIQPYLQEVGLPLALFGLVWAALNFSVGLFSILAHRYEELLGKGLSMISVVMFLCLGFFLIAYTNSIYSIAFLFLFYLARGIHWPVLTDCLNSCISSGKRATVLSVRSFVSKLLFVILGPLFGWVSDIYSLQAAMYASGISILVLGTVSIYYLKSSKAI